MAELQYLTVSLTPKEEKRIFSKISIDPVTGCWNWTGSKKKQGYGEWSYRGRMELIHRVMFANYIEPIPRGRGKDIKVINHKCKNRSCCNPKHLELITDKENFMQSDAPASLNKRKKFCKNGHLLPNPVIIKTTGKLMRVCIICRKERDAKRSTR